MSMSTPRPAIIHPSIYYPLVMGAREMSIYLGSGVAVVYGLDFAIVAPSVFTGATAFLAQIAGILVALTGLVVALTAAADKRRETRKAVAGNARKIEATDERVTTLAADAGLEATRIAREHAALVRRVASLDALCNRQQESIDALADRNSHLRGRLDAAERRPAPEHAARAAASVASAAALAAATVAEAVETAAARHGHEAIRQPSDSTIGPSSDPNLHTSGRPCPNPDPIPTTPAVSPDPSPNLPAPT